MRQLRRASFIARAGPHPATTALHGRCAGRALRLALRARLRLLRHADVLRSDQVLEVILRVCLNRSTQLFLEPVSPRCETKLMTFALGLSAGNARDRARPVCPAQPTRHAGMKVYRSTKPAATCYQTEQPIALDRQPGPSKRRRFSVAPFAGSTLRSRGCI